MTVAPLGGYTRVSGVKVLCALFINHILYITGSQPGPSRDLPPGVHEGVPRGAQLNDSLVK